MEESLAYELDKKLCCGICLLKPGLDIVEMVCPGKCTFCFSCIFQYICHLTDYKEAKCPTCRQGKGGITESPFLVSLVKLNQEQKEGEEEEANTLKKFKDAIPGMRSAYPTMFEPNRYIITPIQLKVFQRYTINPESYRIDRITTPRRREGRNTNANYATVNIDWAGNNFVVSSHFLLMHARRACSIAPSQYTASFIVLLDATELSDCSVVYQARPVQIFMTIPFISYSTNTFGNQGGIMMRIAEELATILVTQTE
jgi:hypothetical protein